LGYGEQIVRTFDFGVGANFFVDLPAKLLKELVSQPDDNTLCHSNDGHDHSQKRDDVPLQFNGFILRYVQVFVKEELRGCLIQRSLGLGNLKDRVCKATQVEKDDTDQLDRILGAHLEEEGTRERESYYWAMFLFTQQ
jgi:hypothetical protein